MELKIYTLKFYLNASHYIVIDNNKSVIHPHTWEIVVKITCKNDMFIKFTEYENTIKTYLMIYEGKLLNDIPPFDSYQPTLENIINVFYIQIKNIAENNGWIFYELTISENPSRSITIYNEQSSYNNQPAKNIVTDKITHHYTNIKNNFTKIRHTSYNKKQVNSFLKADFYNDTKVYLNLDTSYENQILNEYSTKYEINKKRNIGFIWETKETKHEKKATSFNRKIVYRKLYKDKSDKDKFINNYTDLKNSIENNNKTKIEDNYINNNDDFYKLKQKYLQEIALMKQKDQLFRKALMNFFLFSLISISASVLLVLFINRNGVYPWGSDAWGHLYKAKFLYESILKGDFYPILSLDWYNGIEPFRYWAPFPYYVIALLLFLAKGNIIIAYNLFIFSILITSFFGWYLIGKLYNINLFMRILYSLLWFILPDNLRVLFSEGNIPRVVVSVLFIYLMFFILSYFENNNRKYGFLISVTTMLIVFCHAMIAAMVMVTISLIIFLSFIVKKDIKMLNSLVFAIAGILMSCVWLIPALKGGLVSIDQEAMKEVVSQLTYNIKFSLNPLLRLRNIEAYYFGLSILLISIFGFLFSKKDIKILFVTVIIIFLGTTKAFLSIITKLPMNQLFWMMRFTPLGLTIFIIAIIIWKNLRKEIKVVFLILIILDSLISAKVLMYNVPYNNKFSKIANIAAKNSSSKVAVLDLSQFGSYFSYNLTYNFTRNAEQLYGWAWQGATTAPNITQINTGIENEWYEFSIDRCKELGADVLIVKKDIIKNLPKFIKIADNLGYETFYEDDLSILFKLRGVNYKFATKPKYVGLAIGKYSNIISYIFPQFENGFSTVIDDYDYNELLKYKTIFLSGFETRNKKRAENLVKYLVNNGVRVVIDLSNFESELLSSRAEFLGVIAQPVQFINNYSRVYLKNKMINVESFPTGYKVWNTIYYQGLQHTDGIINYNYESLPWLGKKDGVIFLGANIYYYAYLTHNSDIINQLEKVFNLEALEVPNRNIVKYNIYKNNNKLIIKSNSNVVLVPIAALDIFKGNFKIKNNLVYIKDRTVTITIKYSFLSFGLFISLTTLSFILNYVFKKSNNRSIK